MSRMRALEILRESSYATSGSLYSDKMGIDTISRVENDYALCNMWAVCGLWPMVLSIGSGSAEVNRLWKDRNNPIKWCDQLTSSHDRPCPAKLYVFGFGFG